MNGDHFARGHESAAGGPPYEGAFDELAMPSIPGQAGAVWPDRPAPQATGDERVDRLVAGLGDLAGRPVGEHVSVYEDLHHGLQEVLAATGQEAGGQAAAGHEAAGHEAVRQDPRPAPFPRPGPGPR